MADAGREGAGNARLDRLAIGARLSDSAGACFARWRAVDERARKLQSMVDTWHIVAFSDVPIDLVGDGLRVVSKCRAMLTDDCLPLRSRRAECLMRVLKLGVVST